MPAESGRKWRKFCYLHHSGYKLQSVWARRRHWCMFVCQFQDDAHRVGRGLPTGADAAHLYEFHGQPARLDREHVPVRSGRTLRLPGQHEHGRHIHQWIQRDFVCQYFQFLVWKHKYGDWFDRFEFERLFEPCDCHLKSRLRMGCERSGAGQRLRNFDAERPGLRCVPRNGILERRRKRDAG